jgi:branched-chain amino acid transport system substrate-binding protein
MRSKILFIQLIALLAAANVVFAAEPVRIGVSLGLTGKYKELAEMHKRAYRLWENEVNKRGGLLGRSVVMVIRDDESDPAKAAVIYRDLITGQKVDLVFGPYSSEITLAVAPIVEQHGYPTLLPGACADELWEQGYENLFGILPPCSRYPLGILRLAPEGGLRTVAILHADDPFSESVAAGVRRWAPSLKLKIDPDLRFPKGKKNLTGEAEKVRTAGAELLIVAGHFNEAVNVRRALDAIGWLPQAFFATIGPAHPSWGATMGQLAEGAFATSIWEPHKSVHYPRSQAFAAAFRERYKIDPSYHAATAYCVGQLLVAAVQLTKSLERGPLRDALSLLDTYCVIGRYKVDRTGRQVKRLPLIVQWQGGQKEIVWPEEVSSAEPIFGPK